MRRTNSGFVQHVGKKKGNKRGERSEQGTRAEQRDEPDEHPRRPGTPPHPPRTFFLLLLAFAFGWLATPSSSSSVCHSLSRTAQWHCAREERRREEAEGREPVLR